ncbi:MAG: PD-(D/E)XK motif protein, partial [Porphyromonadaceae bacterium]|nr:PD-(D/E)XK motif protein [Porphyromonadaceae bacterium]
LMPTYGMRAVAYWMGPEKTHKDFSFEDTWVEVKTVNFGNDAVTVSSIEQLDGENTGTLAVYQMERMGADYNGIKLNCIINDLLNEISEPVYRDMFMSKLTLYGYDGSPEYDNEVFELKTFHAYIVDDDFPRLKRQYIPNAIVKVQYDISLRELSKTKQDKLWKQ